MKKNYFKSYINGCALFIFVAFSQHTTVFSQGILACPTITASASPDTVCTGNCTNLSAVAIASNQSTNYSVASIPYSAFPYSGGTPVSVGTDDVWSSVVNLGFTFCYFGNSYTQAIIGSNGNVSFNLGNAGGYNSWAISTTLPSTSDVPANTICGPFRDTDPSVSGNVGYYRTGTAPCRKISYLLE